MNDENLKAKIAEHLRDAAVRIDDLPTNQVQERNRQLKDTLRGLIDFLTDSLQSINDAK